MIHMDKRFIVENTMLPSDQASPLMAPRSIRMPFMPAADLPPAHAEEIIRNYELVRAREAAFQHPQEWVDATRYTEIQTLTSGIPKREWEAREEYREQAYQNRLHMEQDAYYRANQEYVRLMADDQNRQSFREKQRLTEDLEKQKRLLIEDLARDQQLRQQKLANDLRNTHGINEKQYRNEFATLRGRANHTNIHPFSRKQFNAQVEPRFGNRFSNPNDVYSYTRMPDVIMPNKPMVFSIKEQNIPDIMHCKHSDMKSAQRSLIPIIQEKEKKIKEMEDRILEFRRESRDKKSKEAFMNIDNKKQEDSVAKNKDGENKNEVNNDESQKEAMSSSPDLIIDVMNDASDQIMSSTATALCNSDDNDEKTRDETNQMNIDENKASAVKRESSHEETSSEYDGVMEKCDKPATEAKIEVAGDYPLTKNEELNILPKKSESVSEEKIGPRSDLNISTNNLSDADTADTNVSIRSQKKKVKQKSGNKKSDTNTDFKASQNRLALDLPNHNWLVERLMQQNKLDAEDISANASNKPALNNIKDESKYSNDGIPNELNITSNESSSHAQLTPSTQQQVQKQKDKEIFSVSKSQLQLPQKLVPLSPESTKTPIIQSQKQSPKGNSQQTQSKPLKTQVQKEKPEQLRKLQDHSEQQQRKQQLEPEPQPEPELQPEPQPELQPQSQTQLTSEPEHQQNRQHQEETNSEEIENVKQTNKLVPVLPSSNVDNTNGLPIITKSGINDIKILSVMSLRKPQSMNSNTEYTEKFLKDQNANIINVSSSQIFNTDINMKNNVKKLYENSSETTESKYGRENNQETDDYNDKKKDDTNIQTTNKAEIASTKEASHSSLLLKRLDPNTLHSSPNRINPPDGNSFNKLQSILPKSIQEISAPPALLNNDCASNENRISKNIAVVHSRGGQTYSSHHGGEPPALTSSRRQTSMQSYIHPASSSLDKSHISYPSRSSMIQMANDDELSQKNCPRHQELGSNLVVMTRKESDSQPLPFQTQYPYPHPTINQTSYSKYIVEERYNRKRTIEEEQRDIQSARQGQLLLELERSMPFERQPKNSQDRRFLRSAPPFEVQRKPNDDNRIPENLHPIKNNEYSYLSRNLDNRPSSAYKVSDATLTSPVRAKITDLLETQNHYSCIRHSPSSYIHQQVDNRTSEKQLYPLERRTVPVTDLSANVDKMYERREQQFENSMYDRRERIPLLMQETRKREELIRNENLMKLNQLSGTITNDPRTAHFNGQRTSVNERIRTVDDLRVLQLGLPLEHSHRQTNRQQHRPRNERLTEREKNALREAEMNSNTPLHNVHESYLMQAHREIPVKSLPSPIPLPTPRLRNEHFSMLAMRQQEEAEKLRLHANRATREREPQLVSSTKELLVGRTDANVPQFYSHKIPRTRNGSLDFGRSKPVDYSFLDYSASMREREGLPPHEHIGLKRTSSMSSSEPLNKIPRRSPNQTYVSAELFKRLSHDEINRREKSNNFKEKSKHQDTIEKRHCKICNKDAQYLCSGCRKAWYCSQTCQLNEWRIHSKTCSGEG